MNECSGEGAKCVDSFLRAFFLRGEGEKHREIPENLAMAASLFFGK